MSKRVLVIGAGISGLSFAERYLRLVPDAELRVLEASSHIGGVIRSSNDDGYTREFGPETVLDDGSNFSGLLEDIGLVERKMAANAAAARRYIAVKGQLVQLPKGPGAFLRSPVLPFFSKLRLFTEPFRKKGKDPEESFGSFIARRFGPKVLENLAEPFAAGIYAGVPEDMEMASCFPKLLLAEQLHGSVIKGLRKVGFKAGKVIGFPGGNQELAQALQRSLAGRILTEAPVQSVRRDGDLWRLQMASGEPYEAEQLVVTCPAYAAATLFEDEQPELGRELQAIRHCSLVSVHCAYDEQQLENEVDGFGFLIPRQEAQNRALGALFSSNLFEQRAPTGKKLIRVLLGGARNPDILPRSDDDLISEAKQSIERYLGIKREPELIDISKWEKRLPVFAPGHQARMARIRKLSESSPPLEFLGSSFTGSGVALCIRNARKLAEELSGKQPE
ncbi:MAG: protoporphyrinogen oxidase [Planctomycetota bacterium]|nr:MAG: protoporphyrinogen oxidase [Planctomycetota bacterium]